MGPVVDGYNVCFNKLDVFKEIAKGGFEIYLKVINIRKTITIMYNVSNIINKKQKEERT